MKTLVAVSLAGILLAGCDMVTNTALETYGKGTVSGVEHCLKNKASELVPKAVVMKICVEKHEGILRADVTGNASYYPRVSPAGSTMLGGTLRNKSNDVVVTKVILRVWHEDNKSPGSNKQWDFISVDNLWIVPDGKQDFSRLVNSVSSVERTMFEPGSWTWNVGTVYGVKIASR